MPEEKKDSVEKDRSVSAEKDANAETDKKENSKAGAKPSPSTDDGQFPLPKINFSTFVISLNASALVHLGQLEDPASGTKSKNLPMAKQTIDILSMLAEKTKGNLLVDEENILKNLLYDLRINYVREKG